MLLDAAEILRIAEAKYGSLCAVSRETGINRSTLKRIKHRSTNAPHAETIALLVKAVNRD